MIVSFKLDAFTVNWPRPISWFALALLLGAAPAAAQSSSTQFIQKFGDGFVRCACFSPDGNYVLTGGDDGVQLYRADSEAMLHQYEGSWGRITSVDFSPDGLRVAGAGVDVYLWDTWTEQLLKTFTGHDTSQKVAFSPDGTKILTESAGDAEIFVWNAATWQQLLHIDGWIDFKCAGQVFSPDSSRILFGRTRHELHACNASTGADSRALAKPTSWINSFAYSPVANRIVIGDNTNTRMLDGATGEVIRIYYKVDSDVAEVMGFSKDGSKILLTTSHGVKVIQADTGEENLSLTLGDEDWVQLAALAPDATTMLIVKKGYAELWNATPPSAARQWRDYER